MTAPLAFVDVETTGLEPHYHEVWEIGLIVGAVEYQWIVHPDLSKASPEALRIGRYYDRTAGAEFDHPGTVANMVAHLTAEHHLVGANPAFDAAFLTRFLHRQGYTPAWHYHLIDVEALMAGLLSWPPPWDSNEMSRAVGVDPDQFDRHTALGDARWTKAIYEAVMEADDATEGGRS